MGKIKLIDFAGLINFKAKILNLFSKHVSDNEIHVTASLKNEIEKSYQHSTLDHAPSDAQKNEQSDWNVDDTQSDAFIKNKPTSLPASDVSAWAKEDVKPSYTALEVGAVAATKLASPRATGGSDYDLYSCYVMHSPDGNMYKPLITPYEGLLPRSVDDSRLGSTAIPFAKIFGKEIYGSLKPTMLEAYADLNSIVQPGFYCGYGLPELEYDELFSLVVIEEPHDTGKYTTINQILFLHSYDSMGVELENNEMSTKALIRHGKQYHNVTQSEQARNITLDIEHSAMWGEWEHFGGGFKIQECRDDHEKSANIMGPGIYFYISHQHFPMDVPYSDYSEADPISDNDSEAVMKHGASIGTLIVFGNDDVYRIDQTYNGYARQQIWIVGNNENNVHERIYIRHGLREYGYDNTDTSRFAYSDWVVIPTEKEVILKDSSEGKWIADVSTKNVGSDERIVYFKNGIPTAGKSPVCPYNYTITTLSPSLTNESTLMELYQECRKKHFPVTIYVSKTGNPNLGLPDNGYFLLTVIAAWRGMIIAQRVDSPAIWIRGTNGGGDDVTITDDWIRIADEKSGGSGILDVEKVDGIGYYGLTIDDDDTDLANWIRTPRNGILPYDYIAGAGASSLGHQDWPFAHIFGHLEFLYWNLSSWPTLASAPTGMYCLSTADMTAITDKPTSWTNGRSFLIKSFITNDEFMILINPNSYKMWVNYLYGSTWTGWNAIYTAASPQPDYVEQHYNNPAPNGTYSVLLSTSQALASTTAPVQMTAGLKYNPLIKKLYVADNVIIDPWSISLYGGKGMIITDDDSSTRLSIFSRAFTSSPYFSDHKYGVQYSELPALAYFCPLTDDSVVLGSSSNRWRDIYCFQSAISTSDRTKKKDIKLMPEDLTQKFILALAAMTYKMIDGDSGRTHWGFIAQDVEELMTRLGMTSLDFAGFIKSPKMRDVQIEENVTDEDGNTRTEKRTMQEEIPGEYDYGLRYEEFIAPTIKVVQMLYQENEALRKTVSDLQKKNDDMQKQINEMQYQINTILEHIK